MADDKKKGWVEDLKEGARVILSGKNKSEAKPLPPPPPPPNQDLGKNIKTLRGAEKEAMDSYKKGGVVKKTGPAKVHKGERVLTVQQSKAPAIRKAVASTSAKRKR